MGERWGQLRVQGIAERPDYLECAERRDKSGRVEVREVLGGWEMGGGKVVRRTDDLTAH